jgi:PTS system mannose-specific IIB component
VTIAIVIGTHGWAAEQLLKTAEMLLGEQENVGWIDFVPGENAETLIEKYNAQLAKLDTSKGVLFLVDTWGGSPFNAASRIVVDKEHYEVIAGVNIPMLVETFMARDDDPSFDELVALAVETGREGVKALKAKAVEKAPAPVKAAAKAPARQNRWVRTTTWSLAWRVLMTVLSMVRSPPLDQRNQRYPHYRRQRRSGRGYRAQNVADSGCSSGRDRPRCGRRQMIRVYNNPKYAGERVMLLFTNPTDVERVVEGGVKITSVNIGGMAFRQGKTQVNNAFRSMKKILKRLKAECPRYRAGSRKVSTDQKLKMMDLIGKVAK